MLPATPLESSTASFITLVRDIQWKYMYMYVCEREYMYIHCNPNPDKQYHSCTRKENEKTGLGGTWMSGLENCSGAYMKVFHSWPLICSYECVCSS